MPNLNLNNLIGEILEEQGISIPKKYSPRKENKSSSLRTRCKVHKYMRFAASNKTYRTDIYYCTQCPSTIDINKLMGRHTKCWKCDSSFAVDSIGYFPLKPLCNECRGIKKTVKESNNNDLVEELMGVIERKII